MNDYIQDAFNSGEICEEALSRKDIAQAQKVVRLALNGTFMVQGGWRRRKGTWDVAAPKDGAGDYLLVPFTRASGQSVILELGYAAGQGYGRVYGLDRARVGTVEFTTPFTQDELPDGLTFLQTGDGLIVCRRNGKRFYIIKRASELSWSCVGYATKLGPLDTEFAGDGATLTINSGTITASAAIFQNAHVGALIRFKHQDGYSPADGWRSGWKAAAGEVGYYAGNYYEADTNATEKTGYLPPVHTSGTRKDGNLAGGDDNAGRGWRYLHDGSSWAVITGYNSPTSVNVGYQTERCTPVGSTTGFWAWGAYNDVMGWPTMAPCIREKRLVMGATAAAPDVVDLTRTNGWDLLAADFKPGMGSGEVVADDAMRELIGGNGAKLQWAMEQEALFIASTDGLYTLTGGGVDVPLKPDSKLIREIPGGGSSAVVPAKTPKSIIYVPLARRNIREISGTGGEYSVLDISGLFEHITGRGVAQVEYMKAPWHQIVLRLDDGGVAFINYNRDQNVLGAARQSIGRMVVYEADAFGEAGVDSRCFSMAVVPGYEGEDQLWLGIERNGVKRTEVMSGYYEGMFLDSAQLYQGAATSNITGLSRFNGQTVQALADGQWHKDLTVSAGAATLQSGETASQILTGLGYTSRLEFLPLGDAIEAGADRKTRPARARLSMRYTYCEIGTTDDENGDGRPEKKINRGSNGKWVEKRQSMHLPLDAATGYDKRVFVEVVDAPFDVILYSAKIEM